MNENRYAPPKAEVDDFIPAAAERSEIGRPALRLATRFLWGGFALGLFNAASQWNYLTANSSSGRVIAILSFSFSVLAFLTYSIGRARNRARIVTLVFAVIGLPSLARLPAVFERAPVLASLSFVYTAIQLIALGIVFFSSARHQFSKRD